MYDTGGYTYSSETLEKLYQRYSDATEYVKEKVFKFDEENNLSITDIAELRKNDLENMWTLYSNSLWYSIEELEVN